MKYSKLGVVLMLTLLAPQWVFCKLLMVALVFRHGERTPLHTYPNDPYKDYDYDGLGFGALTPIGIQQMYFHGSQLRSVYEALFAKEGTFRNYNFQVKTSETELTFMSASSFLAGFYPPSENANPIFVDWQPIPITTIPAEKDFLLKSSCKRALNISEANFSTNLHKNIRRMLRQDMDIIETFEINSGFANLSQEVHNVFHLFDTLYVQMNLKLEMPDWFSPYYLSKRKKYIRRFLLILTETDELKQLLGGPLITEITDEMLKVVRKKSKKRVLLYSGHDTTISALLRSLAIKSSKAIDYGATLAFELHLNKHLYEIGIKYYASANETVPVVIDIPNCESPCTLRQFLEQYKHLIVRDIDSLCQL